MGLIEEYVYVTLNATNVKIYEELGYEIPRRIDKQKRMTIPKGTKIMVKFKDVPKKSSSIKAKCICDICGGNMFITPYNYNSQQEKHKNTIIYIHCVRTFNSGENAWNWNRSLSEENRLEDRNSNLSKEWRLRVFKRDNYKCFICNSNKEIQAHHLDGFNWCKEKRYDVTNGVCLCQKHHLNFHSIYGKGNNTKEQFEEFINNKILLEDYVGEIPTSKSMIILDTLEYVDNVSQYILKNNLNSSRIYGCLNGTVYSENGLHYIKYEDFLKIPKDEIEDYIYNLEIKSNKGKTVVCKTTMEVFLSCRHAERCYGGRSDQISKCCDNIPKFKTTPNKNNSNQRLEWQWLEDYMKENNYNSLKEVRQKCTLISKN